MAASTEAANIDQLFNAMVAISTGLFLLVQGALIYALFAFRKRKGDETDAAPIHGNVPLELVWTAIPSMIVLWLAIYSFDVYKSVDSFSNLGDSHMAHGHHAPQVVAASTTSKMTDGNPSTDVALATNEEDTSLVVNVMGLQYAWLFTYPDTGIISGDLHVPINRPVELNIEAKDVIHAFWVPEFRLKQDAIPGQQTHLRFEPNRLGSYTIICAELCGAYHGAMKTRAIVQTPEDYQDWVQSRQVAVQDGSPTIANRGLDRQPTEVMESHLASMGLQPDEMRVAATQTHQAHLAMVDSQTGSTHLDQDNRISELNFGSMSVSPVSAQ